MLARRHRAVLLAALTLGAASLLPITACGSAGPNLLLSPDSLIKLVESIVIGPTTPPVLNVGKSTRLTATVRGAGGDVLNGVPVTWTADPGVSVNGSGSTVDVTAISPGVANVTATAGDVSASIPVSVLLEPGANDRILLDTRQSLQQATTASQALGLFPGNDHTPLRTGGRNTQGWSFSTNFDGQGTHALRVDWVPLTGDQEIKVFTYLPTPKPREMFIQFKVRLGKHPADADANGTDNVFPLFPQSNSCKRLLVGRIDAAAGVGGNANGRIDYVWTRANPSFVRAQVDWFNWGMDGTVWNPQSTLGRTYTTTLYMKASSGANVADGVYRIWIDGALRLDARNVSFQPWAFDTFSFPTVCHNMPVAASEYYWDVLAWSPASS